MSIQVASSKRLRPIPRGAKGLFKIGKSRRGFHVSRWRVLGSADLKYTFECKLCGKSYGVRCGKSEEPTFHYKCACATARKELAKKVKERDTEKKLKQLHDYHQSIYDRDVERLSMVSAEDGWLLVAKHCHNRMVSQSIKQRNKDVGMFHFDRFLRTMFEIWADRGDARVDPSSLRLGKIDQGFVLRNVEYGIDVERIWPEVRLLSMYHLMTSKKD